MAGESVLRADRGVARADAIVVGSGLLGAVVARHLAESGRRVLIVERGWPATEPRGSHLRNRPAMRDDPDGYFGAIDAYFDYFDPAAPADRLPGAFTTAIFGGVGIAWTNNCPRAVAGVDRPDVLENELWERYYGLAEGYFGVRADQFEDSVRGRAVARRLVEVLKDQGRHTVPLPLSGYRIDATHIHYVGPGDLVAPVAGRVEVLAGSVDAVEFRGDRALGVSVGGTSFAADDVIVAGGAIETPSLLWRSGCRPPVLGRHLAYHPVLIGQIVLDEALCDVDAAGADPLPRLGVPPTPDRPWFVMLLRDTNPLAVEPVDRNVDANRLIEIQAFLPVDPDPDNRMTFRDADHLEFDVPLRADDKRRRAALARDADELTRHLGRYRAGCHPQWAPPGTPHLMGSCRMGSAEDSSVADLDGRVWGTSNLYVATNGVIPNRLAVNPTLTAAALALATADRIAERS